MSEMLPPWKRALKPRHREQEEEFDKVGGKRQPASGRIWRFKRDGVLLGFLFEARTTEKDHYTIKLAELKKIEAAAHMTPPGCLPAMKIEMQGHTWVLTREIDFMERENRVGVDRSYE